MSSLLVPPTDPRTVRPTSPPTSPSPSTPPGAKSPAPDGTTRLADPSTWVFRLTVLNAFAVAVLLLLLCVVSEVWWVTAAMSYLPRVPFAAPSLLLLAASAIWNRRMLIVNLLAAVLVLGPVMGLAAPIGSVDPAAAGVRPLTVVSCNVQHGYSDMQTLLTEFGEREADLYALQECDNHQEELAAFFEGWHRVKSQEFWVCSRYPVEIVDRYTTESFERLTVIVCEVQGPQGPFLLANLHLSTARPGLEGLRWHSPLSGAGVEDFEWLQWQREQEMVEVTAFLERVTAGRPTIICGDFNTPTSSSLYATAWSHWSSAFDTAGCGYGYTSPCNTGRLWPTNTPWLRIDHILVNADWQIGGCSIGTTNGSDHRLIAADLLLTTSHAQ